MVAVPLCGRRRVIGLLEAFSAEPFGFNDSDVRNLTLLAELVLAALKPEDEDRFASSAEAAAAELGPRISTEPQARAVQEKPIAPISTRTISQTAPKAIVEQAPQAPLHNAAETARKVPDAAISPAVTEKPIAIDSAPAERAASHRPGVILVLVSVVVAAMLAGVIWWKLQNARLNNNIVRTESPVTQPAPDAIGGAKTKSEPVPVKAADAQATPAANANTDSLSETAQPPTTPATVQELAKFPHVSGIRHWSSAESSTVVLDLEDQIQYEAHRLSSPERIYFDLRDTALAPELFGKNIEIGDALINRIRVAQPVPGLTRVVLETKGNSNFSVSLEPNPYRLVVQVTKIGASPKGAINLFPNEVEEANRMAIVVPPPSKEDLQLRARVPKLRIVVDAGHGGWDLGTVGRRGLLEKDLVLEIGQRLGKLLESRLGSEIIYTRQDDNYVSLDDRAGIANQAQADLFISVHANYSDLPSARGVETYYTNFFSPSSSKESGGRENGKNGGTGGLTPVELHERIGQSRRLAASVQRSLYAALSSSNPGLRDRGIKEAGFVVLTETSMPGILAEVSFVSSPTDEQRLRSDGYRERIAEALYKGVARYAANSHGVKVAAK